MLTPLSAQALRANTRQEALPANSKHGISVDVIVYLDVLLQLFLKQGKE